MSTTTCRICNNAEQNRIFVAHEMMFGTREAFEYFECDACGCVQIADIPDDLSPYYPDEYYAFERSVNPVRNLARKVIDPYRARQALNGETRIGKVLETFLGVPEPMAWIQRVGIGFDDAMLDVGCGIGLLLQQLHRMGFSDLTGIDPYIKHDLSYGKSVVIFKKELHELDRTFDFIMLHHVFEHLADPLHVLHNLYRLVNPGGHVLIRIPIASSYAWRTYGTNWAQLDAPRHLFLHTYKSMERLADQAGFKTVEVTNDSTAFQFWGSEQCARGIPLMDERSYLKNERTELFTAAEIASFKERAEELNAQKQGDASCFYLRKD